MKANIYGVDVEYSTQEELSEIIKELRAKRVPKYLKEREALRADSAKVEVFKLEEPTVEAPKVEVQKVEDVVEEVGEVVEEKLTLKTEDVKSEFNQKKRK